MHKCGWYFSERKMDGKGKPLAWKPNCFVWIDSFTTGSHSSRSE